MVSSLAVALIASGPRLIASRAKAEIDIIGAVNLRGSIVHGRNATLDIFLHVATADGCC